MYFVITSRHVKHQLPYSVTGPFVKRSTAERCVLAVSATYSCIGAQVLDRTQIEQVVANYHKENYVLVQSCREALRRTATTIEVE